MRHRTLHHGAPGRRPVQVRLVGAPATRAPAPYVVLVHGFKGFMDWGFFPELAARLAGAGLVAVAYNASHNGVSASADDPAPAWDVIDDAEAFRANTHTLELEDLALVREAARAGELGALDPTREGLLGHSRGGGIVALSSAARAPRALALWAPIDDIDRVDAATRAAWRGDGVLAVPNARTGQVHELGLDILDEIERRDPRLDVLSRAREVAAPALVVHGTRDDAVPVAAGERLAAALPRAEFLRLEGANHAFGATHPLRPPLHPHLEQALAATVAHFQGHLARPPGGAEGAA